MSYYARAYGLVVEGTLLGISTEEEPTAAEVKSLTEGIQAIGVPIVFAELTSNDKVLRTVANEADVDISEDVLIADGIGKRALPLAPIRACWLTIPVPSCSAWAVSVRSLSKLLQIAKCHN